MKTLYKFFPAIFLILSINCFSQLDSLKGKVKRVYDTLSTTDKFYLFIHHREIDFGQLSLSEDDLFTDFKGDLLPKRFTSFYKERAFNEKGQLISTTLYRSGIGSNHTKSYEYDDYGNLVQELWGSKSDSYIIRNKYYKFFRDSLYRLSSEITYEKDPSRFEMKQYFYDDKYNLIEEREINSFGPDTKTCYSYDNLNRQTKEEFYRILYKVKNFSNESTPVFDSLDIIERTTYKYYETGHLKEKAKGYVEGFEKRDREKTVYTYDNKNRKSTISYYWGDSLHSRKKYEYNESGLLKRISYFRASDTVLRNYIDYFYQNNEISKVYLKEIDKETTFEFRYKTDSHNNWIEQEKLVNGELFYTRKRIIEYW